MPTPISKQAITFPEVGKVVIEMYVGGGGGNSWD